jgi:peptide-methionine (R)-S-oxide reductase
MLCAEYRAMRKQPTRTEIILALASLTTGIGLTTRRRQAAQAATPHHFTVNHTDLEWRKLLTPEQYEVLRKHGTEAPGSSPLDGEQRKGTYLCAGCSLALFSSTTKFHSGTGWPSFYQPLSDAVETSKDYDLIVPRVEVHCRRCGGHLGHLFDDGPKPTGLRYCMNGAALTFEIDHVSKMPP